MRTNYWVKFLAVFSAISILVGIPAGIRWVTAEESCPFFNDEDLSGWSTNQYGTLSFDTEEKTEGDSSLAIEVADSGTTVELMRNVSGDDVLDLTGMNYLSFDLWIDGESTDMYAASFGDCGVNFRNEGTSWDSGVMAAAGAFRTFTLFPGWNKVEVKISYSAANTVDLTQIAGMRMYFQVSGVAGKTVRFDNFAVSEDALYMGSSLLDDETSVGWSVGPTGKLAFNTENKTDGNSSLAVTVTDSPSSSSVTVNLMRTVDESHALDLTGMKYISFDLWVDEDSTNMYSITTGDCGINLCSSDYVSSWSGGVNVPFTSLRPVTLVPGWNRVEVPINYSSGHGTDITKIVGLRVYFQVAGVVGKTVLFDNFAVTEKSMAMGTDFFDDEAKSGWSVVANGTLSYDTEEKTTGESSLAIKVADSAATGVTVQIAREVDEDHWLDLTGMKYLSFDLWVDEDSTGIYKSSYDCGINFRNTGERWESGVNVPATTFRPLTLTPGWNRVEVPINYSSGYTADLTKIGGMRIYFQVNTVPGKTVRFDNFAVTEKSMAMGTNFFDDEATSGWTVSTGTLTHDKDERTAGSSSLAVGVPDSTTPNVTINITREVDEDHLLDLTGMKYFSYDIWLDGDSTGIYQSTYDCGINFRNLGEKWESGVIVPATTLRPLTLHAGWNHVEVPIDLREGYTADLTKIGGMRIYFQIYTVAGKTVRFDNFSVSEKSLAMGTDFFDDEATSGWTISASGTLAYDTEIKTKGNSSLAVTVTDSPSTPNLTVNLMRDVDEDHLLDLTGMKYISFDLWVDEDSTDMYSVTTGDCGINFRNLGEKWESGVNVPFTTLRPLTLESGWNRVEVPINYSEGYTADITKIGGLRVYFQVSGVAGKTVRFDNFAVSTRPLAMGTDFFDDEAKSGWAVSSAGTLTYDREIKTKGETSLAIHVGELSESVATVNLTRIVDEDLKLDLRGINYLSFDLWVDENGTDMYSVTGDCGINFRDDGNRWETGVIVPAAELKAQELNPGWNRVVAKIHFNDGYSADISDIVAMRFYLQISGVENSTIRVDNFSVSERSPYETTPIRNSSMYQWLTMDQMPSDLRSHGTAVIDRVNFQQGTGSLKTVVDDGVFSISVACNESEVVDVSPYNAFEFDLYLEAEDIFQITENQIEITSSGKYDEQEMHWTLENLDLERGWNHLVLSFSEATVTENFRGESTVDLTNINYLRMYTTAAEAYENVNLTFRIDNLCFTTNGVVPEEYVYQLNIINKTNYAISATAADGVLPDPGDLLIYEPEDSELPAKLQKQLQSVSSRPAILTFVLSSYGLETKPNGTVNLTVGGEGIPADNTSKVYRMGIDGTLSEVAFTAENQAIAFKEDGYLVTYLFAANELANAVSEPLKDGSTLWIWILAACVVVVCGVVTVLIVKKPWAKKQG